MAADSLAEFVVLEPGAVREIVDQLRNLYLEATDFESGTYMRLGCSAALHAVTEHLKTTDIVEYVDFVTSANGHGLTDPHELVRSPGPSIESLVTMSTWMPGSLKIAIVSGSFANDRHCIALDWTAWRRLHRVVVSSFAEAAKPAGRGHVAERLTTWRLRNPSRYCHQVFAERRSQGLASGVP